MKKITGKILFVFIIIIMLFEFSFSNSVSYAVTTTKFGKDTINSITNLCGGIVSIHYWIIRIITLSITFIGNKIFTHYVAESCGINNASVFSGTEGKLATPFDIFFNKYKFLDVNFFDVNTGEGILDTIRKSVANWFYVMRLISVVVLLCILIYVGIRMALSSVAENRATYKKMLFDWVISIALVFFIQYLAIFVIKMNDALVAFFRDMNYESINNAVTSIMWQSIGVGFSSIVSTFVFCLITFQTLAFFIGYVNRMLKVGFLLIIAPLIAITYPMDKMGDGKAQALSTWLKEFIYTILIQPFHCVLYLAFANTAVEILNASTQNYFASLIGGEFNQLVNGILVILCFKFINDAEGIIRKIFHFEDDNSHTALAAGVASTMIMVRKAKQIGIGTAKIGNGIRTGWSNIRNNVNADLNNPNVGGKIRQFGASLQQKFPKTNSVINRTNRKINSVNSTINNKTNALKNKLNISKPKIFEENSKFRKRGRKATEMAKKVVRNNIPKAAAIMGAAVSYSGGTSGVLDSIAAGNAVKEGVEGYMDSANGTFVRETAENFEALANDYYESQKAFLENNKEDEFYDENKMNATLNEATKQKYTPEEINKILATRSAEAKAKGLKFDPKKEKEKIIAKREKEIKDQISRKKRAQKFKDARDTIAKGKSQLRKEFAGTYKFDGKADIGNIAHSEADLTKLKDNIVAKILEFKANSLSDSDDDENAKTTLDENDYKNATASADKLEAYLGRRVAANEFGENKLSTFIEKETGMSKDDESFNQLMESVLDYSVALRAVKQDNTNKTAKKVNLDPDNIYNSASKRSDSF